MMGVSDWVCEDFGCWENEGKGRRIWNVQVVTEVPNCTKHTKRPLLVEVFSLSRVWNPGIEKWEWEINSIPIH